jgi:hypothetical protein
MDRSANGPSASVGLAGRIMRRNSRDRPGTGSQQVLTDGGSRFVCPLPLAAAADLTRP